MRIRTSTKKTTSYATSITQVKGRFHPVFSKGFPESGPERLLRAVTGHKLDPAGGRRKTIVAGYDLADNPLNKIEWAFAAVEVVHITSLALSIGTIAIVDMSLLGLGLRDQSAAKLLRSTELLTMAGLTIVISSGLALFTTDPLRYYYSPTFRLKMVILMAGIVFNYTIHRRMTQASASPVAAKAAGAVSLAIWISVIFCGLFFAFTPGGY
jgi:hypothetical protein